MTDLERRLVESVWAGLPRRCALCDRLDTVQNPVGDDQLCADCRTVAL